MPTSGNVYEERVLRALLHIEAHLDNDIPLERLARVACFSPFHFHRVFSGVVGETVSAYVRRLRLERAVTSLAHTEQPIENIARAAGYSSHEAFTRAFQAQFGCLPSMVRRQAEASEHRRLAEELQRRPRDRLRGQRQAAPTNGFSVAITRIEPLQVAFVRHVGSYAGVGTAWKQITTWAQQRGLVTATARTFGLIHDDPYVTAPDRLRYDACIAVGACAESEDPVRVQVIGGGLYGVARHCGGYADLERVYDKFFGAWLPNSDFEPENGPSFHEYLPGHRNCAPAALQTDVYVPLRPQARGLDPT